MGLALGLELKMSVKVHLNRMCQLYYLYQIESIVIQYPVHKSQDSSRLYPCNCPPADNFHLKQIDAIDTQVYIFKSSVSIYR